MNENLIIARKYLIVDQEKLTTVSATYGSLANKEDAAALTELADEIGIKKNERPAALSRFSQLINTIIKVSTKESQNTALKRTLNVEKLRRDMLVKWEGNIYRIHRIQKDGRIKISRLGNKSERQIVPADSLAPVES